MDQSWKSQMDKKWDRLLSSMRKNGIREDIIERERRRHLEWEKQCWSDWEKSQEKARLSIPTRVDSSIP